jgi:trigger factor
MAVTVETLEKLERKITLTLSAQDLGKEVETRLKKVAKTVKMPGFRPGKVPMNIVAQQYGYSAQYEVMNEKVGRAFNDAVIEAELNVAGQPKINELEGVAGSDELKFEAIFEVYPVVTIKDLSGAEIQKFTAEVNDEAIEKTVAILRKQRRSFAQRGMAKAKCSKNLTTRCAA